MLLKQILKNTQRLSNEQIYDLYASSGDTLYLDAILVRNRGIVCNLARDYNKNGYSVNNSISVLDLEQEGFIGYMEGLKRYDRFSGNKINTFCYFWAKKYIAKYYGCYHNIIKYPDDIVRKYKKIRNVGEDEEINITSYTSSIIRQYSSQVGEINDEFDVEDIEPQEPFDAEFAYYKLICEPFSEREIELLELVISSERGVGHKGVKELLSKIKNIYETIRMQTIFVLPLERDGEYLMTKEEYEHWQNGFCGDKKHLYPSKEVFEIEKNRLEFVVNKLANGFVLLSL
jgi:DNA-directed RNA polymerase specialized sigma subunit